MTNEKLAGQFAGFLILGVLYLTFPLFGLVCTIGILLNRDKMKPEPDEVYDIPDD